MTLSGLPHDLAGACVTVGPGTAYVQPAGWRLRHDEAGSTLEVGGVGRFDVATGGRTVDVATSPGAEPDLVRGWLFGTVLALVLSQQGRFALHATTVVQDEMAVALAGPSGAGKSTTSLRLVQDGWVLVADDVSPVDVRDGLAWVAPVGRPVHVWPETAAALRLDVSAATPLWAGADKLQLAAPPSASQRLGLVVVLLPVPTGRVQLRRLSGAAAIAALAANAYREEVLRTHWGRSVLDWAVPVAATTPVWALTRPQDRWCVDEVMHHVAELTVRSAAGGR